MNNINIFYKGSYINLSFVDSNDKEIPKVIYENRQYSLVVNGKDSDKTDPSIIKEVEDFVLSKLNGAQNLGKNQLVDALLTSLNATILTDAPNVNPIYDVALSSIASAQEESSTQAKIQTYLLSAIDHFGFQGSVLIRKGKNILADSSSMTKYSEKIYDSESLFQIGSLTKLLIAAAIMRLVDNGQVQINQSINQYLPETHQYPYWKNITVEDLLTHRSGLPNYHHPGVSDFSEKEKNHLFDLREIVQMIQKRGEVDADKPQEYNNSNFIVLGLILEKVSEKHNYQEALKHLIFDPCGMCDSEVGAASELREKKVVKGRCGTKFTEGDFSFQF